MQNDEELADALSLVVLLPYDDAMHKRGLCHRVVFVRPSVCLSVRHVRIFCRNESINQL